MKINTKTQYLFVDYRNIRSPDILLIFCSKEIKARNNIIFIFDATSGMQMKVIFHSKQQTRQ
jgi:hypothetical protein